jgi:hypothetical protein
VIKAPSIPSGSSLETTRATDWSSVYEEYERQIARYIQGRR